MSFRLKTILGIAIIESILLIVLIFSGLNLLEGTQHDGLIKRAESTTRVLATTAKDAVLTADLASLTAFTREFIQNPEVLYIRILDINNDVMASAGHLAEHQLPLTADFAEKENMVIARAGILVEDNLFGWVEAAYSKKAMIDIYDAARTSAFIIAGTELLLVALFSFALGTYLSSQLSALKKAAEKVAVEDYTVSVQNQGSDEIAQVGNAFNLMTEKLRIKKQLDDTNLELLEAIQHTRPSDPDHEQRCDIFDSVLEKILQLTHNQFGMILTIPDNTGTPQIQSANHHSWSERTRLLLAAQKFQAISLNEFSENIEAARKNASLAESLQNIMLQIDDQQINITSHIVIPILHHGIIQGYVILSNIVNEYDRKLLLEKNRLAWISVANLIYFYKNNDRLARIQNSLAIQKKFITSIYESIPDSIISITNTGEITSINRATLELFGYDEEELLGKNISLLMPEPYKSAHDSFLYEYAQTAKPEEHAQILIAREVRALTREGKVIPVEISINHIFDSDGKTNYVGIVKDLSSQKQKIEEIRLANRLATQSYVERYQFITTLQNTVFLPATRLNEEVNQALLEQAATDNGNWLTNLHQHTSQVQQNAENLVYYFNLLSGSLRLRKRIFSLAELIEQTAQEATTQSLIKDLGITTELVELDSDFYHHDDKHMGLVFHKILQYMQLSHPDLNSIHIRLEKQQSFGNKDRIQIRFTGNLKQSNEISPAPLKAKSDDMGLKVAGLMLGHLNGNLSTPLNGNLVLTQPDNGQIRISISINLTRSIQQSGRIRSSCGSILLVDDDAQVLKLTRIMLENIGFVVHTANNGQDAIDRFMDNTYTAVFLDCSMPIMDGYAATQVIREYEESRFLQGTPLLAATGRVEQQELTRCLTAGMNDYLVKPFNIEDILIKLALHITDSEIFIGNKLFEYQAGFGQNMLLEQFLHKAREYTGLIATSVNNNDRSALGHCIQSLQNMCRAIQQPEIHELAVQLEYQSKLNDQSAIRETLGQIESTLSELQHQNHLKQPARKAG